MLCHLFPRAALVCMFLLAASGRAEDPLKIIPGQAEVVIAVNVKTIAASDLFKSLQENHPQVNAQIEIIQNLTGINITRDAERVVVFGKMDQKDFGGIIFIGKYDKAKMLALLQANPRFKESRVDNLNAYEWLDAKKNKMCYAAVLPDNTALICNSKETGEACLAALRDPAQSYAATPEAGLVPADSAAAAAWALVVNRSEKGPAARYKISALSATVLLPAPDVSLTLSLVPRDGADVAKWVDLAKGLLALAQLQPDKAEIREIAAAAKAAPSADGKSATLTIAVAQGKLLQALGKKARLNQK